jgi:hypothetical protein
MIDFMDIENGQKIRGKIIRNFISKEFEKYRSIYNLDLIFFI